MTNGKISPSGSSYAGYMGRWSRKVATEFLKWLSIPSSQYWLDVGCGTGVLSEAILERYSPRMLYSVDPSANYIEYAKSTIRDERVKFFLADDQSLPCDNATIDVVVCGLALNLMDDQSSALSKMTRATKLDGIVSAYVWDFAGKMEFLRYFWDAAASLDSAASILDHGSQFALCSRERLYSAFEHAGLTSVEVIPIDAQTVFKDLPQRH